MAIQLRPRNFDLWIIAAAPATMFFPHFVGTWSIERLFHAALPAKVTHTMAGNS
jgi:hypothetical protein